VSGIARLLDRRERGYLSAVDAQRRSANDVSSIELLLPNWRASLAGASSNPAKNILEGRGPNAEGSRHTLYLHPRTPVECRSAGGGVRGRDRRIPRGGPGAAARVSTTAPGTAHPRAVRRGLLSSAHPVREHRRTETAPAVIDRGRGSGWLAGVNYAKHQVEAAPTAEECLKSTLLGRLARRAASRSAPLRKPDRSPFTQAKP
jgi:hypothetical protein